MNTAEATIRYKTFSLVIVVVLIIGGVLSYEQLGRLEDPEFTIKDAQVITFYPGATPKEVEEEVTEKIEREIQKLGQLKRIESLSQTGKSTITVKIKDKYNKQNLPQVWDELRRKVADIQSQLPPGAKSSIVYDDYGDVYGILLSLHGDGYSYKELNDYAEFLQRELLQVKDVSKIEIAGNQQEQIFVEISREKMSQLGISMETIFQAIENQNLVQPSGDVRVDNSYIQIKPSGALDSINDIKNISIKRAANDKIIYLKDIATVTRGYITPPTTHMRYNGKKSLALGISTLSGGNVVKMGEAIEAKIAQLMPEIPAGLELDYIYYQGEIVKRSVDGFVINLAEALLIVIVVLMVFMGLRSGVLIGLVLLLTVAGTLIIMNIIGVSLERISLGALIIALGMLVDNAIVVTEGMIIRIQKGEDKLKSAGAVVKQTMWPLLAATAIAVLAFAAIGLSSDSTGEFLRSLFLVMLISLGLSWIIAITLTPLFCVMLLEPGEKTDDDPYKGFIFVIYKSLLLTAIRFRWLTVMTVMIALAGAIYAFNQLEDSFFPDSTSEYFMVHLWLPEGNDIRDTSKQAAKLEKYIQKQEAVTGVTSFVGGGAPRFMLVYSPEKTYSSYAFFLVKTNDYTKIEGLMKKVEAHMYDNIMGVNPRLEKVRLGPGGGFPWEVRISGRDPDVLRDLSSKVKAMLHKDGGAKGIRDNWRERVKKIVPEYADQQARRIGITRKDIANALNLNYSGTQAGLYREKDKLIPIISRAKEKNRDNITDIDEVLVWSPFTSVMFSLRQVIKDTVTESKDANIQRWNKQRTLTVQAEPSVGNTSVLFNRMRPQVEAMKLPIGYRIEWDGEYEDSTDAQAGLSKNLPVTFLIMVLITIALFNALRQPLIIWLTVPLSIIGVAIGLTVFNLSFGFMALLGFLSLSGMLIKNAIVLIDEIDSQIADGKSQFEGIVDASVSRLRPVTMAAITTILGMMPLLFDVFFVQMAVTIMFGLAFATILTLIVVPVFYVILFRVKYEKVD